MNSVTTVTRRHKSRSCHDQPSVTDVTLSYRSVTVIRPQLTIEARWYNDTPSGHALMAHPEKSFQTMLMAECEGNEPQARGVLLFLPAFLNRIN
jgi:hypothetical protein